MAVLALATVRLLALPPTGQTMMTSTTVKAVAMCASERDSSSGTRWTIPTGMSRAKHTTARAAVAPATRRTALTGEQNDNQMKRKMNSIATGDLFGHPRTNAKVASMIAAGQSPDGLEFFARELEIENRMLRDALTACHAAMLGKVNPKHPAWGVLFAAQDSSPNEQADL